MAFLLLVNITNHINIQVMKTETIIIYFLALSNN